MEPSYQTNMSDDHFTDDEQLVKATINNLSCNIVKSKLI